MSHDKNIINLYRKNAQTFDRERNRSLFEKPWFDAFASHIPSGGHILDLGCGPGQPVAEYFISLSYQMTGIDAVPEMIHLSAERFPDHTWHVSDMRDVDLSEQFDGILAWNSFFHLNYDDQRHMFSIFEKHVKSGAPLMFTAGPAFGTAVHPLWGEPLYHASLDPREYQDLMTSHGFQLISSKIEDPDCADQTIYLAKKI